MVRLPALARRGRPLKIALELPKAPLSANFVWIPPGEVLYGSAAEESVRAFLNAVPQHPLATPGFWMARRETTFGEWTAYLDSLPLAERERRTPRLGTRGVQGYLSLERGKAGWSLEMQPGTLAISSDERGQIHYPARDRRSLQRWSDLPVVGISFADAEAYAAWSAASGRVPGARLCDEREWERAAKGADSRLFPHGDTLAADDANIDATYGKDLVSMGPDEVGSHPESDSVYGIADLAGNAWEWVRADDPRRPAVARGGGFDFAATSARIANREIPDADYRYISLGMRLCAD